jgi:peptidoglycan/LPS O-acetylase OafA/YrhL
VVPLILAGTVLHPASFVSRCLEWAPIRWVGRLSYSLYLWQQLFLTHTNATLPVVQTWPFNVFAAFVFSAASYYLVEEPMIRVGHRIAGAIREKRKQAAVAAAATA